MTAAPTLSAAFGRPVSPVQGATNAKCAVRIAPVLLLQMEVEGVIYGERIGMSGSIGPKRASEPAAIHTYGSTGWARWHVTPWKPKIVRPP